MKRYEQSAPEPQKSAGPSCAVASGSPLWVWSERNQCWNLKAGEHSHATVWPDGTWHTWDTDGVGGENDVCKYSEYMPFENRHHAAKREAWASCERQGFILENK